MKTVYPVYYYRMAVYSESLSPFLNAIRFLREQGARHTMSMPAAR
jgi:hypothetical protein